MERVVAICWKRRLKDRTQFYKISIFPRNTISQRNEIDQNFKLIKIINIAIGD